MSTINSILADGTLSSQDAIDSIADSLEREYRAECGFSLAFKSRNDFKSEAFHIYYGIIDERNARAGKADAMAEDDYLDYIGRC